MHQFAVLRIDALPVVASTADDRVIGTLHYYDIINTMNKKMVQQSIKSSLPILPIKIICSTAAAISSSTDGRLMSSISKKPLKHRSIVWRTGDCFYKRPALL